MFEEILTVGLYSFSKFSKSICVENNQSFCFFQLTLFKMGGGSKKFPPYQFFHVTSAKVGLGPQKFSFNPIATLV